MDWLLTVSFVTRCGTSQVGQRSNRLRALHPARRYGQVAGMVVHA